jgi:hypothetical protein
MFTLEYAKDPFWNNEEGTSIHLTLKLAEFNEEIPFSACSFDSEAHGVDLFNRAKNGEFGKIAPYTPPATPSVNFEPISSGTQNA